MTYEEAIVRFNICERECDDCLCCAEHDEAVEKAIEALERAIPKKPFVEPYFYGKYYRCPTCGRMVEKNKCCSNNDCRQRINWSK